MSDAGLDKAHSPASSASTSFSATARRWTKWASTFIKKEKPLGSEPWFNPEADTKHKREWLEQQKAQAGSATSWPEHIYENFFVLGLPPDMEVTQVAEQLCELERKQRHHEQDAESEHGRDYVQPPQPSLAPQVLFSFPPGSSAPISDEEVAALAFPSGVAPEKLKRTPSLSGLDELIMGRDSDAQQQCFVFMLKVGGNFPLYGCCWYVREVLHRPPYVARQRYRNCKAPFRQCLIAAPRCYCLLSHYPFFELHFRVLKIILDLERLERLLEYDTEKSQLPLPSLTTAAGHPGHSTTTGRSSSAADAPLGGAAGRRARTQSHQGDTAGHHGPLASHSSGAAAAAVHVHIPVLHNRQSYCSECANIIEDMCPFTPGMSPVPAAPLHHYGDYQQQKQQQLSLGTHINLQQQSAHYNPPGGQQIQPIEQQLRQHQPHGQASVTQEPDSEQHRHWQQEHQQLRQPSHQHHQQHHLQQQLCDAHMAHCDVCEVCGKPLGQSGNDEAATTGSSMQNGTVQPSTGNAAATAETTQSTSSKGTPEGATHISTAAIGPLETGVFHHHLQQLHYHSHHHHQQHQQQSGVTSFVAAKEWVAFTGMNGTPAVGALGATQQQGFDAAAASAAVFDNAAILTVGGSSTASSSPGVASEDRWQNLVAAIRGAASAPLLAPSVNTTDGGLPADGVTATSSQPPPLQQESSLVQRMWDVWAPRTSVTPTGSPRASGLANFLRRASGVSSSSASPQSEQHLLKPLQHSQQHQHLLQHDQHGPGLYGPAANQSPAANVGQQGHQELGNGPHASYDNIGAADTAASPAHVAAAAGFAGAVPEPQGQTAAAFLAAPRGADDLCLHPLSSAKAISSSATSMHSSHSEKAAEHDGLGSLFISQPEGAAVAGEPPRGPVHPAAVEAGVPPAAAAAAASIDITQQGGADSTVAGAGTAMLASRAVHRQTPSVVSNSSSFYSAAEHLGSEWASEGVDTNSVPQPTLGLQLAPGDVRHQHPQQDNTSPKHQQPDAALLPPAVQPHRQSSTSQPSSDAERLVSAFAAIAAAATPFGTNALANGSNRTNSLPAQETAIAATGDKPPISTSSIGTAALHSSVEVPASSGLGVGEAADAGNGDHGSSLEAHAEAAQDHPSIGVPEGLPSSSRPGQHVSVEQQQEGAVQGQPIRRGPSGRRSQMFEEVALRRSGEMSAELCKTISHLVQVDSASLLSAYRSSPVPLPGDTYRLMLRDLYRLEFERVLPLPRYAPPGKSRLQHEVLTYAEVECAQQLQLWTVAALCRSLSLDNIITVLNAALLEKQIVVFCPHIGTLAAVVLSLVPLLRPFSWQSLMLPVTPTSMMAFLEAPVPFALGVQYKTPSVMNRCHGLLRVNVYKNAIKNASFPALPNSRQLLHALAPHHSTLCAAVPLAVERPVHLITPDEEAAAVDFLTVLHDYMSQLCGDLRLHTVVNVGMTKRTGVFMKDSLIESVQAKDRPFMKAFVETQMFAVYADGVISDYCES